MDPSCLSFFISYCIGMDVWLSHCIYTNILGVSHAYLINREIQDDGVLAFWNFSKNIKITEKILFSAEEYRRHYKVGIYVFLNFHNLDISERRSFLTLGILIRVLTACHPLTRRRVCNPL